MFPFKLSLAEIHVLWEKQGSYLTAQATPAALL